MHACMLRISLADLPPCVEARSWLCAAAPVCASCMCTMRGPRRASCSGTQIAVIQTCGPSPLRYVMFGRFLARMPFIAEAAQRLSRQLSACTTGAERGFCCVPIVRFEEHKSQS